MKKIPGSLLKNLEKSWKYHGILSVGKSGNPVLVLDSAKSYISGMVCEFSPAWAIIHNVVLNNRLGL